MNDRDLMYLPAWKQRELLGRREVSSLELTQSAFRRITALDPKLNAFVTLDEEGALARAKQADKEMAAGRSLGPLHGIPISVKDLELTKGLKTTLGSELFKDWVPEFDSAVVERIRAAGAVILGKTNTPEFGNREETFTNIFPACNNPWNTDRMPGGSSGGAAASVASGMCAVATGTDGGGSVRLPAGFCGIFGHKPTQGRVPRFGGRGRPAYNAAATSGPMTNDVRDGAVLSQIMSGHDPRDPGSLRTPVPDYLRDLEKGVEGMRIGVSLTFGYAAVDDSVAQAVEEAGRALEELGATVEDANLSFDPVPREYWWTIWTAGQDAMYGHLYDENPEALMPYTREMIEAGRKVTGAQYSAAMRQAEALRIQMADLFKRYDVLLGPTSAATAWSHLKPPKEIGSKRNDGDFAGISYGAIPFTMVFNISWNPAASIPCGFDADGMPIGLQVVAGHDDDATVFRACRAFEKARPWTHTRPSVS